MILLEGKARYGKLGGSCRVRGVDWGGGEVTVGSPNLLDREAVYHIARGSMFFLGLSFSDARSLQYLVPLLGGC